MITTLEWHKETKELFSEFFKSPKDSLFALEYAKAYCEKYDSMVRKICDQSIPNMDEITLCDFGSPARYEMLGQSDLDCLLIREDEINIVPLREKFMDNLKSFDFSKLDIPMWGSLTDCGNYLKKSVTEGNQLVEARYVSGDKDTWDKLENLRKKYCTEERFSVTFCFQYLYFNQYYKQRERAEKYNLKYGHGGTRDFLFPVWLAYFREGYEYLQNGEPAVIRGIQSLLERKDITNEQSKRFVDAANVIALMRNELLRISYGTDDPGLTYLGKDTAENLTKSLPNIYVNKNTVLKEGLDALKSIINLKEICYSVFMNELKIKNRIGPNAKHNHKDELCGIVMSWNTNLSQINKHILDSLSNSSSWSILTSLACNPTCPEHVLDILADKGSEQGYEYVMKIVGRNPNTRDETLKKIVNSNIELRFIEPAKVRLEKGWKKANESQ